MECLAMCPNKTFKRPAAFFAIFITSLPAYILFAWHASKYGGWLIDDAGISFAYAKNLATGQGLVPQPGQLPVEGFSNPLWTFLLSTLYSLDLLVIPNTPKIVSHALTFLGFFALAATIRNAINKRTWMIVAGGALMMCAANPAFVIWSVSGLENPLLVCLGSTLLFLCAQALHSNSNAPPLTWCILGSGLIAAAMALTRPDGIVYAATFPIALTLRSSHAHSFKGSWKAFALYLAALGTPLLVYLVFRLNYFNDWLPNTYYAKPGTSWKSLFQLIMMAGPDATKFVLLASATLPFIPLALPLLLIANTFQYINQRQSDYPRHLFLLAAFVALGLLSYMVLPIDWMTEYRFATLPIMFFYALLFATLQWLLSLLDMKVVSTTALTACLMLTFSLSYFDFRYRAEHFADKPTAALENVFRAFRPINEFAVQMGLPRASILMPDLGATLMYSDLHVIDLAGLCDRKIGRLFHQRVTPMEFSNALLERHPDFIQIHGWWAQQSGLRQNAAFNENYIELGDDNYLRRSSLPKKIPEHEAKQLYAKIVAQLRLTNETPAARF
jgi:hypothetical protein